MSSTGRSDVRREGDAYYTPDDLALACVCTLPRLDGLRCVEPSAGGGAYIRAMRAHGCSDPLGIDIDPNAAATRECELVWSDFLDWQSIGPVDWIIGNPPFRGAEEHIRHALSIARCGVAFLLRLAFLEGQARALFWAAHPPESVHVLSKRPSFTGGGTDSAAYGWFVWRKDVDAFVPRLDWLQWGAR